MRKFCLLRALQFGNAKDIDGFEISLATEPVFHRNPQSFQRHAETHLQQAIAHWQGVVEDGVVGEVPHGKIVDPLHRAWMPLPCRVDGFDLQFAQKHAIYSCARGPALRTDSGTSNLTKFSWNFAASIAA